MHVCGQTLVLVDNDATESPVNQKIVKATLKYIFYHMPENRTFCLCTYEHDVSSDEVFSGDVNDLVCAADGIEFSPKDSNLTDTLSEVVGRWKNSDFACRDIVVFTDGLEGGALGHEKEEMYYLLENSGYPVYIVMLEQDNNAEARKQLSAIAVTSGGRLFSSEFEGSDAEVDRQLTEMIFSAMDEYAIGHWGQYEESEDFSEEYFEGEDYEGEDTEDEYTEDVEAEEYGVEGFPEDGVVYEYSQDQGFFAGTGALILSAALILAGLLAGVLGGFLIMKRKRAGHTVRQVPEYEEYFDDYELSGADTEALNAPDDGATRLLSGSCRMLTLTDNSGSGRSYRVCLTAPMSVGRGDCDVMITGDDALSKRHCELYESDGSIYVRDLASANGTRVNGVKVSREKLKNGDELTIGARTYAVVLE